MEIQFFNSIFFWKKYFKDLLKIFLIELKEKLYYNYLKGIILYPGLCSIFLVIALIFFCDNSTAYAYDLPEIWAVENLENDFKTYCTSNPQRFQDAYNDYLTRKRARGPFSALLAEGNSKKVFRYTYNSTLKVITNDDFYKALLENEPKIRRHSTIEVLVDLQMQMNQAFIEFAGLNNDTNLGMRIETNCMNLLIKLDREITMNDEEKLQFFHRMQEEEYILALYLRHHFKLSAFEFIQADRGSLIAFKEGLNLMNTTFSDDFNKCNLKNFEVLKKIALESMRLSYRFSHRFIPSEFESFIKLRMRDYIQELITQNRMMREDVLLKMPKMPEMVETSIQWIWRKIRGIF